MMLLVKINKKQPLKVHRKIELGSDALDLSEDGHMPVEMVYLQGGKLPEAPLNCARWWFFLHQGLFI